MKYRMENLNEFIAKCMALNVREIYHTQKITSKKVNIPVQPSHPAAVQQNQEVDYVTGVILFTARGMEKTSTGLSSASSEFVFFAEELQPSFIKNEEEAKAFLDMANKRRTEIAQELANTFGSTPAGEVMP